MKANANAAEWERFYKSQNQHVYHDRHWLWQVLPEVFPVPPGRDASEIYSSVYYCPKCHKVQRIGGCSAEEGDKTNRISGSLDKSSDACVHQSHEENRDKVKSS